VHYHFATAPINLKYFFIHLKIGAVLTS